MIGSRRRFLGSAIYAGASMTFGLGCSPSNRSGVNAPSGSTPAPRAGAASRPRQTVPNHYVVVLFMNGGYDPVLTFDPKEQDKVAATIDCEFRAADRVKGRERMYGPLIGELIRHESDLCIVNGVRLDTVAHIDGFLQTMFGRRVIPGGPPTFVTLAEALPGDAPASVLEFCWPGAPSVETFANLGEGSRERDAAPRILIDPYTARSVLGEERLSYARPPHYDLILRAQRQQLVHALDGYPEQAAAYQHTLTGAGLSHDFLSSIAPAARMRDPKLGMALEVTYASIKQNRAKLHMIEMPWLWFDSHTDNLHIQTKRLSTAFHDLALFIDLLKAERNEFGTLYDQTTVLISTEIGRFPKLNVTRGKDHWPETTWVLFGKGIKKGATVGSTDDHLRGAAIDFRTGRSDAGVLRPIQPQSVWVTLMRACGANLKTANFQESDVLVSALA